MDHLPAIWILLCMHLCVTGCLRFAPLHTNPTGQLVQQHALHIGPCGSVNNVLECKDQRLIEDLKAKRAACGLGHHTLVLRNNGISSMDRHQLANQVTRWLYTHPECFIESSEGYSCKVFTSFSGFQQTREIM